MKHRIFVGVFTVLVSAFLTGAILIEWSPLYQDARENSLLRILLMIINLPSVTVGAASGNLPFTIFVFVVQWFVIGFFVGWLLQRISQRNQSKLR